MKEKILPHLFVIVVSFFGMWFLLSRIDFVNEDELRKFSQDNERRLTEFILKSITATNEEIENEKISTALDSIKARLCRAKKIDCSKIKIHVIKGSEVNAFALPDHTMVIYTGLLEYAESAEEVAGVMAHEIGHMEKNHVMKKLTKEIGIGMLFAIISGDAGGSVQREAAKVLSSSAFDRKFEREADEFAVEALALANIDPQPLSDLFFRLSRDHDIPEELAWISTHPDSKERAAEIIRMKKEYTFEKVPILQESWKDVQKALSDSDEEEDEQEQEAVADSVEVAE